MQSIELPNDEAIGLSLRNLRTIVAIAGEGSLTAAGARLGYAQTTVSMHLAAAESSLGVSLFRRNGRGVVATEAGRSVLRHATALFGTLADLRSDASHTPRHKLTIGATEAAASPHIVAFFKRYELDNPDVELAIRIEPYIDLCEHIERGTLDIAIVPAQGGLRVAKFIALYDQMSMKIGVALRTDASPPARRLAAQMSRTLARLSKPRLNRELNRTATKGVTSISIS
jgi:DNA-binding transcriptional LysR family regulator